MKACSGAAWASASSGTASAIFPRSSPTSCYRVHRFESDSTEMRMIFRDHTISDLIGFVYSGMSPVDAAHHLMDSLRRAAQPLLAKGQDALISVILDGENAWEYYPRSGREFLRRFYELLERATDVEALTVSEALARDTHPAPLRSLVPGSWINANFNVWIGAPEDNRSWDYLAQAREFYREAAPRAAEAQRQLAFEELMIAEGSDWNWWYGPEHHSANDRDFDELYRTHLSNVYQTLGAALSRIPGAADHCRAGPPVFHRPDSLHPAAYHRGAGPLLRVDGSGHVHCRPAQRLDAREAVSAGLGPRRNR